MRQTMILGDPAVKQQNIYFWCVCVNLYYVPLAASILQDTPMKVFSVVRFPLGANTPEVKASKAEKVIRDGANEIDMVINIGALKSGDEELVEQDIKSVVKQGMLYQRKTIVKVIIETGLWSDKENAHAQFFLTFIFYMRNFSILQLRIKKYTSINIEKHN